MKKGVLTVVSGFAGSGKGTIMNRLLATHDNYALSVSATTRSPRPGEVEGVHYFFKTEQEFEQMIREGAFLEYASYVKNSYGTPRSYVEEQLAAGRDVILEIEIQGALRIRELMPEAILVFVTPPSAQELKKRLVNRGTETPEVIASRIARAAEEAAVMKEYDYILVNDDLEETTEQLHRIIDTAHHRPCMKKRFITTIEKELQKTAENE